MRIYKQATTYPGLFVALQHRQMTQQPIRDKETIHKVLTGEMFVDQSQVDYFITSASQEEADFALEIARRVDATSATIAPLTDEFKQELRAAQLRFFARVTNAHSLILRHSDQNPDTNTSYDDDHRLDSPSNILPSA